MSLPVQTVCVTICGIATEVSMPWYLMVKAGARCRRRVRRWGGWDYLDFKQHPLDCPCDKCEAWRLYDCATELFRRA